MTDPTRLNLRAALGDRAAALARRHALATCGSPGDPVNPLLTADDYDAAGEVGAVLADRRTATWHAAIPNRFAWATLADFDGQPATVVDALADWAARPAGRNLILLGPVGTGKSHAAVAACRPCHDTSGLDVRFAPLVELLDLLRPGGPEDAFAALAAVDLLIVDDLGSERATDWTAERLGALVNRRWLEARPTVCTSNLDPDTLAAALGERVFSRLIGCDAVVLRLTGDDRRRRRHG